MNKQFLKELENTLINDDLYIDNDEAFIIWQSFFYVFFDIEIEDEFNINDLDVIDINTLNDDEKSFVQDIQDAYEINNLIDNFNSLLTKYKCV